MHYNNSRNFQKAHLCTKIAVNLEQFRFQTNFENVSDEPANMQHISASTAADSTRSIHTNCRRRLSRQYFNEACDADISPTLKTATTITVECFVFTLRTVNTLNTYIHTYGLRRKCDKLILCTYLGIFVCNMA